MILWKEDEGHAVAVPRTGGLQHVDTFVYADDTWKAQQVGESWVGKLRKNNKNT